MTPVYPRGHVIVSARVKILNFRLSESLQNEPAKNFCSAKLSQES